MSKSTSSKVKSKSKSGSKNKNFVVLVKCQKTVNWVVQNIV